MKVKISRPTKEPSAGDCYYVADYGPCLLAVAENHYQFVILETGITITTVREYLTAKELIEASDCRRINDPITLTPD